MSTSLLDQARRLGVNVFRAYKRGLAAEVRETQATAWMAENQAAIDSSNAFVDAFGLPLARHRRF